MESKFDYIKEIYQNLDHIAAYSGVNKLYKYIKQKNDRPDIGKKDIEQFLRSQDASTYHGSVPRRFVRRPIKVCRPGLIVGSDLCDMTDKIAKHNDGFRYVVILMDIFSRKVSLTAVKRKTCGNIAKILDEYLTNSTYQYAKFFADEGAEFTGKAIQKIYKKYNIVRYNIFNRRFKNAIVERFVRTLKSFLYRYFTQNNTFKFIDVLEKYEKIYNSTPHVGLGLKTPDSVHKMTDLNEIKTQEKIQLAQKIKNYGSISRNELKYLNSSRRAFEVGTHVRLLLNDAERIFGKSYEKIFSDEIFVIRRVDRTLPISYWLKDLNNKDIKGVVYHKELKRVELPKKYFVEKVVQTRKNRRTGKTEYFVKWVGWPQEFNSWVDKIDKT